MHSPKEKLTELFRQFPGIGNRQAGRFVYHILKRGPQYANDLAQTIQQLTTHTKLCPESFQYFETDDPTQTTSPLTRDPKRNNTTLLVVEKDTDITAIERSHAYTGQYFVLGGLVSMIQTKPSDIRLTQLLNRIERDGSTGILQEIILGFSYSPEAEHTRTYIQSKIEPLLEKYTIRLSLLGRGLAYGSEIEYMDSETIKNALNTRK